MKFSNKFLNIFVLAVVIIASFFVRLYKIDAPITDKYSREQSAVLMNARTFYQKNDIRVSTKSSIDNDTNKIAGTLYNPSRLPLTSFFIGKFHAISSQANIGLAGRMVMILASLIIIASIFFLALRMSGRVSATGAVLFAGFFPYFILHSRVINNFLVPLAVIHLSIVFLYLSVLSRSYKIKSLVYFLLSLFLTALALVTEPMLIVFLLPIGYLLLKKYGINSFRKIQLYAYVVISVLPSLLYNVTSHTIPQLLPLPIWSNTLENPDQSTGIYFLKKIFLTSLIKNRIIDALLGSYLIGIVFLGIIKKIRKGILFKMFLLSSLLFLLIFAKENMHYESLQMILISPLAFYFGIGLSIFIHQKDDTIQYKIALPAVLLIIILSIYFSFITIQPDYSYNNQTVQVSKIIKVITQPNDLIATDTKDDNTILVLSDRSGIPSTDSGETNLISRNIKYLVTFNKNYAKTLSTQYKKVFSSSNGYIFELQ